MKTGRTSQLPQTQPSFRGLDTETVAKTDATFDLSPDSVEKVLLGLRTSPDSFVPGQSPIIVSVSNGHLKYARYPLLIGHFDRDGILSAEKAVEQSLNGELSRRIQLGLYPGPIGSNTYLETKNLGGLKGVIVVGLGRQGGLNEFLLMNTIELGVSNYLVNLIGKSSGTTTEPAMKPKTIGISALLVGSGYGGLSIEGAVRAILQAIQNANQKVLATYRETGRVIEAVEFIELYTDRALACVKAVSVLEKEENKVLSIKRTGNSIRLLPGRRGRLPVEDTQDWWTRINVQPYDDPENLDRRRQGLKFAVATDAARIEEASLTTDSRDLFRILDAVSVKDEWTPRLAKVIFEMLIPNDFKQQVKRQNNISWQLDSLTAAFPWELLQDSTTNAKPLSVNAGMIRQLATPNFRRVINSVIDKSALVIADPNLEGYFGQLPGARSEGGKIAARLKADGYDLVHSSHQKSAEIRIELLGQDYKIIHLAGHGAFEFGPDKKTGMLIGRDSFLTPDDIRQMSGVPELVFVNCCYLGQMAAISNEDQPKPYRLAANIGTRLIEIGVKAVVVAGWAVSDATALEFAEKFYDCLFSGDTFGESVKRARQAIFDNHGTRNNTWGAYQCYGDPFYRLTSQAHIQSYEYTFIIPEEAEIELGNMLNQLDTGSYEVEVFQKKMKGIALGMERTKISSGKITELQALLYSGMGMYQEAIGMFGKLGTLENPVFSFSAWEKYCSVRAKFAVQKFKQDPGQRDKCLEEIQLAAEEINALNRLGCTNERLNLLGSTYKRLGLISNSTEKTKAYETSAGYYRQATDKPDNGNRYYSLSNWLAIENALVQAGPRKWGEAIESFSTLNNLPKRAKAAIAQVKQELEQQLKKEREEASFWDCIAEANLRLVLMLLGDIETPYSAVKETYEEVWKFTGHKGNRLGELEHLDFLIDLYGLIEGEKGKKVLDLVVRLRRELEAIG
ncbi:CHAT domain-containing protein [Salmonirosea aquatica]|uniref:CHAT domain-containing protein n=1 Tax=Salmonirosea aquatica TaxID=2654236 RepID=A0A7C9BLQ3_9BACT|nr:CHAT domain-containing protein [Cytophagaceae bacterium SJW1-29]